MERKISGLSEKADLHINPLKRWVKLVGSEDIIADIESEMGVKIHLNDRFKGRLDCDG